MDFKLNLKEIQSSRNIDELMTRDQADHIARTVIEGYQSDKNSRTEWENRYKAAQKLALQVVEAKSWPWEGAANVKFPLLTVATLQFAARAYGALIRPPEIVKCRVIGQDPQGMKRDRAARVSQHMSYQVLEEDEPWEEEHDKLFMTVPIVGTSFTKTYYDPVLKRNCSKHVLAWDLVMDYWSRSVEETDRKTHTFYLFEREIRERQLAELYSPVEISEGVMLEAPESGKDERQGLEMPTPERGAPRLILEQHLWLDLDGDGYPEPYVATVERFSAKLLRLVHRFEEVVSEQSLQIKALRRQLMAVQSEDEADKIQREIAKLDKQKPDVLRIKAIEYFTKWGFIPSPDGGVYDLGFGALLGPVNETVNTIINQLIDSGTLSNLQSGFIGRGARIRGDTGFRPGEWKYVDVPGADLKASIVPLPAVQPSPVLFNMLGMLVNYGERIASVTDIMVGENVGQNTPAYTSQQLVQQGMTVFSGIFKRMFRSLRDELRRWYLLNRLYLSPEQYFTVLDGPSMQVFQTDYLTDPTDIRPAADPSTIMPEEKMRQAAVLAQRAATVPGYNLPAVELRLLEAMGITEVNEIYPVDQKGQPVIPPPVNPEIQVEIAEEQRRVMESRDRRQQAQAEIQIKAAVADADVELKKAQTIEAYARAGKVDIDGELARFGEITNRLKVQADAAKAMLDAETKREIERQRAASGGMAQKSGNGSNRPTAG